MKIGLGVTGSFCTFKNLLVALGQIIDAGHQVMPVFSYVVSSFDTRFFKAKRQNTYTVLDLSAKKSGAALRPTISTAEEAR